MRVFEFSTLNRHLKKGPNLAAVKKFQTLGLGIMDPILETYYFWDNVFDFCAENSSLVSCPI